NRTLPLLVKDVGFDGHTVTAAIDHHHVIRLDDAFLHHLEESGKGDADCRFDGDAVITGKDANGIERLFVAGRDEMPAIFVYVVIEEFVGASGVACGKRSDDGTRVFDRGCNTLIAVERFDHRRTARRLHDTQRWHFVYQAELVPLAEALADADGSHAAAYALNEPIRRAPALIVFIDIAEFFRDLVCQRFHRLNRGDTLDPTIQKDALTLGEFRRQFLRLVVGAGDLDHFRAVKRRLTHFVVGRQTGEECPQFDARTRSIRRIRDGDVSGAGDHHCVYAHLAQRGNRHRCLTILEAGCWSLSLIFEIEVLQTQIRRQRMGFDEGGAAFAEGDNVAGIIEREHFMITP